MVIREPYVNYRKIDFQLQPRPVGIRGGTAYADCICAFDIETTRLKELEQSFMYVWQFCIDYPDGSDIVIIGRTWREFKHMTWNLTQRLDDLHLRIYIHNASYEFQFLAGIYDFSEREVFALESRSILNFSMYKRFEFYCSYKLFNMSLDAATAKYCPDYHKKTNTFDYDARRFADTPLSRKELLYCVYDVWGLCKAVRALMVLHGDNNYTIPRTATGFVRREVRDIMRPYHCELVENTPPFYIYKLLRAAFRGGDTHANRYYAGEILINVRGRDIASSYPTQQCTKQFPVTKFTQCENTPRMLDKMRERGRALLIHCILRNVVLRNKYTAIPYLPIAKCQKLGKYCGDNGRILSCHYLEICITDIDLLIIEKQYSFDMEIIEMYKSIYGYLPEPLQTINKKYYEAKTALKCVQGQELYYMKSKNLLNAIYGMSVQSQTPERILFSKGAYIPDMSRSEEAIYKAATKAPYTLYQFGVWTTCHARNDLQHGIDICGDNLVYVDTDSCKYLGDCDFSAYNARARAVAKEHGAFANDKNGQAHYMGVYEDDGLYTRFVTLGAKKYAYEDEKGRLHITVSGVPKTTGAQELLRKGGLEAFTPGFVFTESGKLESVYNDGEMLGIEVDGRVIDITRNVVLRPTTYALDITADYGELLSMTAKSLNNLQKFWRNCQL